MKDEADLLKASTIKTKIDVLPPLPDMAEIAEKYMKDELNDSDLDI